MSISQLPSVLEAGTVTIKNRLTRNSACLPSDEDGRSLQTKPNNGSDSFKVRVLFAHYTSDTQESTTVHHLTPCSGSLISWTMTTIL